MSEVLLGDGADREAAVRNCDCLWGFTDDPGINVFGAIDPNHELCSFPFLAFVLLPTPFFPLHSKDANILQSLAQTST